MTPLLAAALLRAGAARRRRAHAGPLALLDAAIRALVFGVLIEGLGTALLAPRRPGWRLGAGRPTRSRAAWPPSRRRSAPRAGLAAFVAGASGVLGPEPAGLARRRLLHGPRRGPRSRRRARAASAGRAASSCFGGRDGGERRRPARWLIAPALAWAAVAGAALALLAGYLGLARFLTHRRSGRRRCLPACCCWPASSTTCFPPCWRPRRRSAAPPVLALGAPPDTLRQLARAALRRDAARSCCCSAPRLCSRRLAPAPTISSAASPPPISSLRLGQVTISPGAILGALALFAAGLALTRGVRRWLESRYLPTTRMDIGVRASLASAVTYLGVADRAVADHGLSGPQLQPDRPLRQRPVGRHRLWPAGDRRQLHLRPHPAGGTAGEGRRLDRHRRSRGRREAHQHPRHRDRDDGPVQADRAQHRPGHQDGAQCHRTTPPSRGCASPCAPPSTPIRRSRASPDPAPALRGHPEVLAHPRRRSFSAMCATARWSSPPSPMSPRRAWPTASRASCCSASSRR